MTDNRQILAQTLALANAGLIDDPALVRAIIKNFARFYTDITFSRAIKGVRRALGLLGREDAYSSLMTRLQAMYMGGDDG